MPAKKTPKKKVASPSRSTSRSRKTTKRVSTSRSRSRTRSASRTSAKGSKPATPTRRSPARKPTEVRSVEQVKEDSVTPIRASRRLQEKAIQQVNERCASWEHPPITPTSDTSTSDTPVAEAHSSQHIQDSLSDDSLSSYHTCLASLSKYALARSSSIQEYSSASTNQLAESSCRAECSESQLGRNYVHDNAHKRIINVSTAEARSPSNAEEVRSSTSTGSHAIAFGGDLGGAFLSVALPFLVFYITLSTTGKQGWNIYKIPMCPSKWSAFFDAKVFAVVLGWYAFQLVLAVIPVGPIVAGQPLKNRRRLMYRCNGWLAFYVTSLVFYLAFHYGYDMEYVERHWLQFVTAGVIYSCIVALFMYVRGRNAPRADLAPEATGSFFNDFWMGRELNPRFMNTYFDYKFFFELRGGLLGWMIINWCLLASQFNKHSAVTPALAMVTVFQTLYVFDALRNESAILTTLDITTEGFGFMLAFGDFAWVPALYTLQGRFIHKFPANAVTNYYALAAICVLEVAGVIFFRGANRQKNEFRKNPYNPELAHLSSIPTAQGKRLLCSGFWGICRRPNYLGDIMMALAWSLPCGCSSLIPYFYPISFVMLLVHRCVRDEAYCRQRYGAAWDKYCAAVPYRIIPYVF